MLVQLAFATSTVLPTAGSFLDPDLRDEATLDDAAELLAQLGLTGEPEAETLSAGDRFMVQNHFSQATELDVRRRMGSGFATAVMQLAPGRWHGPVLSGYGVHLVYVQGMQKAPPPSFAEVRPYVLESWRAEQQEKFQADFFDSLKSGYNILISDIPEDRILDSDTGAKSDFGAKPVVESSS